MRLALPPQRDWPSGPELAIDVYPIVPSSPRDTDDILLRELPDHADVRRSPPVPLATDSGWPATLHRLEVHAGGALIEARLVARYELLLGLAGHVVVRARDHARLEREAGRIVELLVHAWVELASDAPAAVAELWDL